MDLNWDSHPFQTRGTFNAQKMAALRDLLKFYDGIMFWAGDWNDPVDEMHHQMDYGSYDLERQGKLATWIKTNIRPDGFSMFRRGTSPQPVPADPRDAAALAIVGQCRNRSWDRDRAIACLSTGMQESNLNQAATDPTGHRGVYQQDGGYPNRETLEGNVGGFFDRLAVKLASPGSSPDIWKDIFWLQQRPSEPSADAAYTNGRQAYLTEIQSHRTEAAALYDRLAASPTSGGTTTLADVSQDEWDQLVADVKEIRAQLSGDWPQNGNDPAAAADLDKRKAAGERLTPNDLLAWLKNHVSMHKAPTP